MQVSSRFEEWHFVYWSLPGNRRSGNEDRRRSYGAAANLATVVTCRCAEFPGTTIPGIKVFVEEVRGGGDPVAVGGMD